jgi:hypothetical protein
MEDKNNIKDDTKKVGDKKVDKKDKSMELVSYYITNVK